MENGDGKIRKKTDKRDRQPCDLWPHDLHANFEPF